MTALFDGVFRVLRRVEEAILAGGILVVAAVTIVNVVSRTLLDHSLAWAEEVAQFVMIIVTFVGTSYAAGRGRHIRMSAFTDLLGVTMRRWLFVVLHATTAVLLAAVTVYAANYVASVHTSGTTSPALRVPLYVIYAAAPVGFGLAALQFALAALRNLLSDEAWLSWERKDEYEEELPGAL